MNKPGLTPDELRGIAREVIADSVREVMTTEQAAEYLQCSRQRLDQWRHQGNGPPFVKMARLVRYRRSDLDKWLGERVRSNTNEI
jgi:excisionase family DNA binding protein